MFGDVFPDFVQTLAGGFQALFELGLGFDPGLAQRRLYAAMGVYFASPEVSIGRKIMPLNLLTTADCTPSDREEGMQPKGFRDSTIWHSLCTV
jgi:hypothetical protein